MEITKKEIDEIFRRWYKEMTGEDSEGATDTFLEYLQEIRFENNNNNSK